MFAQQKKQSFPDQLQTDETALTLTGLASSELTSIDAAIAEWLAQKERRTGSAKTRRAYADTLADFRAYLHQGSLDLLGNSRDIARLAPLWASLRRLRRHQPADTSTLPISANTYNQRLAIVSSWYTFVQETYHLDLPNPIKEVKKRPVQPYATSLYLDDQTVETALDDIDRQTPQGLRDYAILAVALSTGRRAKELVELRGQDIQIMAAGRRQQNQETQVRLSFHCKGGKILRDLLDPEVSAVLLEYLHVQFGEKLAMLASDAPVWVSYSRRNHGQAITARTLSNICADYLPTSKVHALRHTFAHGMLKSNASLADLAARLGHTDLKVTQRYGRELTGDENPHAEKLTAKFGIKRKGS